MEEVKGAVDLRERKEVSAKEAVPAREEAWEGSEVARAEHASAPIAATKSPINKGPHVSRFNVPSADEPWLGNRSDIVKECSMSKIAITSEGPGLDDQVDPRFGRAAGFVVVDLDTMETRYIDNGQSQVMAQGAGIQAAELIARAGVSCLLTGYVGPKAFRALSAAGIKIGQNLEGVTVREAVERFKSGSVQMADGPNREAGR